MAPSRWPLIAGFADVLRWVPDLRSACGVTCPGQAPCLRHLPSDRRHCDRRSVLRSLAGGLLAAPLLLRPARAAPEPGESLQRPGGSDFRPAIPETIAFDLAPRTGGAPYRIFLRIPPGPAPEKGWPTLYMLDGNAVIGTAADALRVQASYPTGTGIRDAAVIATGYPTERAYDSVRRSWDMGPPPGRTYPPHTPDGPAVRTGGADHFLAFIENELKPHIARRLPVDPARQALFGHSFGGLFVLHALFTRPDAFAHWISVSPAIWWEDAAVLRSEAAFAGRGGARVLLAVAEYEQALAPFHERLPDRETRRARYMANRVVDNAREMADRLARVAGLEAEFVVFEGETHMSVLPLAINRAIRFAFGPDAL